MLKDEIINIRKSDPLRFTGDINLGSVLQIHDCMLRGLSSLGNITRMNTFCMTDNQMIFNTTLRMRNLQFYKTWTWNLFVVEQTRSLRMNISVIDCNLQIFIDTADGIKYSGTSSVFANADDFKADYDGLGPLNFLVNSSLEYLFKTFKGIIESVIESHLNSMLLQNLKIIFHT